MPHVSVLPLAGTQLPSLSFRTSFIFCLSYAHRMLQDLKTKSDIAPSEENCCCSPRFYLCFVEIAQELQGFLWEGGGGALKGSDSAAVGAISVRRFLCHSFHHEHNMTWVNVDT